METITAKIYAGPDEYQEVKVEYAYRLFQGVEILEAHVIEPIGLTPSDIIEDIRIPIGERHGVPPRAIWFSCKVQFAQVEIQERLNDAA